MDYVAWGTLALSVIGIILIPMGIAFIRLIRKWTQIEDRLTDLAKDMRELVEDKDKVHSEILGQMREDRKATDRRLRWLEEHLWKQDRRNNDSPLYSSSGRYTS
jgi:hypothetical protein